jgi:hypothetical protein
MGEERVVAITLALLKAVAAREGRIFPEALERAHGFEIRDSG